MKYFIKYTLAHAFNSIEGMHLFKALLYGDQQKTFALGFQLIQKRYTLRQNWQTYDICNFLLSNIVYTHFNLSNI